MEADEDNWLPDEYELLLLTKRIEKIKMDELFEEPSTWEDDEHFY